MLHGHAPCGGAVVNDQVKFPTIALPERSLTPLLPPTTLAVNVVDVAKAASGVSVAVSVAAL